MQIPSPLKQVPRLPTCPSLSSCQKWPFEYFGTLDTRPQHYTRLRKGACGAAETFGQMSSRVGPWSMWVVASWVLGRVGVTDMQGGVCVVRSVPERRVRRRTQATQDRRARF